MAIFFVYSGNSYPYRRNFRDAGPGVEFRNQTREWWVPADNNGEIPYSLRISMRGVTWRRVVTVDDPPRVQLPPQAPSINGYLTREQTIANSERVDREARESLKPARTRRPIREAPDEVAAENASMSELEASVDMSGENIGENYQEPPQSDPNACPF